MLMGEIHVNGGFPAIHLQKLRESFQLLKPFFFNILKKKDTYYFYLFLLFKIFLLKTCLLFLWREK